MIHTYRNAANTDPSQEVSNLCTTCSSLAGPTHARREHDALKEKKKQSLISIFLLVHDHILGKDSIRVIEYNLIVIQTACGTAHAVDAIKSFGGPLEVGNIALQNILFPRNHRAEKHDPII